MTHGLRVNAIARKLTEIWRFESTCNKAKSARKIVHIHEKSFRSMTNYSYSWKIVHIYENNSYSWKIFFFMNLNDFSWIWTIFHWDIEISTQGYPVRIPTIFWSGWNFTLDWKSWEFPPWSWKFRGNPSRIDRDMKVWSWHSLLHVW